MDRRNFVSRVHHVPGRAERWDTLGTRLGSMGNWPPSKNQWGRLMTSPQSICLRLTFDFPVVRSFAVMILYKSTQTWPVSTGCEKGCFYDMAGKTIHFTHLQIKHYFESHWPYIVWNRWKSSLKARSVRVSLNQAGNGNVNTVYFYPLGEIFESVARHLFMINEQAFPSAWLH